ncbi:MAG: hypothetical protein ABIH82_03025, partial [Candidatus Woesearchaeota archaeon]
KNLPPEDRIKKLKELEKKRKKESEEAQKVIKDSESELTERRKWTDRVPMPEFAREDFENLSEDAKQILEHRGVSGKIKLVEEKKSDIKIINRDIASSLEETVSKERVQMPQNVQAEYGIPGGFQEQAYKPLSQLDMMGISKEVKNIYQAVEERGYMTGEEQKQVGYALSEVEKRLGAVEEGEYKGFNEKTAEAANLIKAIGSRMYHN